MQNPPVVLAVGAHPDDIEFMMAGTLLRLGDAGCVIHMWNIADGRCGSVEPDGDGIAAIRLTEARASAGHAGAVLHLPVAEDILILYEPSLIRRTAAVIREVAPDIILAPSPDDYMEDHRNASRLVANAAFVRGMPNFVTAPPLPPVSGDIAVYHALPYGLRDDMRRIVRPGMFVDIEPVMDRKRAMLTCHESQRIWLDMSQGVGSYIGHMERMAGEVADWSGRYRFAEGWRRHLHLGLGPERYDPLSRILDGSCMTVPDD